MNLVLIRLCLATILLVVFVQAQYQNLTPEQKKKLRSTIAGSMGKGKNSVSKCSGNSCGPGYVCANFNFSKSCLVPEGNKCNFNDKCQGGYYCLDKGSCSGSGRKKEGEGCNSSLDCDNLLYCDMNVNKCLVNKNEAPQCYKPSDCANKCSAQYCTCVGSQCVPR